MKKSRVFIAAFICASLSRPPRRSPPPNRPRRNAPSPSTTCSASRASAIPSALPTGSGSPSRSRATDAEKEKRDSDIWIVSWDGAQTLRMTSSPESESSPRWSPDGRSLAFLASRGTDEEKKRGAQVWLLDMQRAARPRS